MRRRLSLVALLLVAAAVTLGACGSSPEDKAYSSGKDLGSAVQKLYQATDLSQAQAALKDIQSARDNIRSETASHIGNQAKVQASTLQSAIGNLEQAGASTTSGGRQDALNTVKSDIQDLRAQASSFEDQNDSIANSFWRGFDDGFDD